MAVLFDGIGEQELITRNIRATQTFNSTPWVSKIKLLLCIDKFHNETSLQNGVALHCITISNINTRAWLLLKSGHDQVSYRNV